MVNIIKESSSFVIQGDINSYPFKDGKISLPLNSLFFVIDESNVISFKQTRDNNTLLMVNINNLQINGKSVTKENLIEKFDAVANGNVGGGGSSTKLNEGSNITLTEEEDGSITISATGELAATVNWEDVQNKPNVATQEELASSLLAKQDTLVSGTNIKTINGNSILGEGDLVIQGGTSDVDKNYVDEQLALKADKSELTDYLTIESATSTYQPIGDYSTNEQLSTKLDITTYNADKATFALKTEIPDTSTLASKEELEETAATKQDVLVSGENIKTINGTSILGEGNIEIQGGSSGIADAPSDNKLYGRKNGNWSEVVLPDTSTFATKTELNAKVDKVEGYSLIADTEITRLSTVTNYNDTTVKADIQSLKDNKADKTELANYATTSYVDETFATKDEIPEDYVLPIASADLLGGVKIGAGLSINNETGVLSAVGGGVADSVDWANVTSKPDDIVNITDRLAEKANVSDLSNYLTTETASSTYQPIGDYATTTQLETKLNVETYNSDKATFALKSEIPDTSNLATKEEVNSKLSTETYNADKATFALKSEIPNLSGYATEDWVESQGYLTEHQDISNLATKEELNSKLSTETYNADKQTFALKTEVENTYAKKTEIQDTSTFATKTELEGKADKTQIADMLTKTEAASTYQPIGSYLTEIPSEYITDSELNAKGYKKIEYKTQVEYNSIAEKEEGVLYVITDAPEIEIPDTSTFATKEELNAKQDTLVNGTNIKSINGNSILGSGDLAIATTQSWVGTQIEYDLINPKDANTLYFIVEEGA